MKTLFRTLAILAAALLVVAGLLAFRETSYGQSLATAGHDRGGYSWQTGDASAPAAGQSPSGFRDRGPESHGPSLFAAVELLKNLAIIAVSITLIALGSWMIQRGRRDQLPPTASNPG